MSKLINKTGVYVLPRQDGTLHWIEFKSSNPGAAEPRVRFLYDHRPKKRDVPFIAVARIEENIDGTWTGCAMNDARRVGSAVFSANAQEFATEEEAKIACLAAYLLTYGKDDT